MLDDPYRYGFEESGLEKKVAEFAIKQNKKFFSSLTPFLTVLIDRFCGNDRYDAFNIFFGCYGGWQRSVAAAEYFKNWLKIHYPDIALSVKHLAIGRHSFSPP